MTRKLKLVATPLGNVNDISLRAIQVIRCADTIFAEDTRHSLKLFNALDIALKPGCRLISCDAHKEVRRTQIIVEKLHAGDEVVFLSDAGSPTISDPGSLLAQGVIDAGFEVEIIPGPSAHVAALMGAGVDTTRFAFLGFLPHKASQRKALIMGAAQVGLAVVIYESPLRVLKLLDELHALLGARRVVVGRELTKAFETFHRGHLGAPLVPAFIEKGECVVIVEAQKPQAASFDDQQDELKAMITRLHGDKKSAKDIAKEVSLVLGLKKSDVYDLVMQLLKKND